MNQLPPLRAKFSMKNILAIIFIKAIIITAAVNFYMVSILPDASVVYSAPALAQYVDNLDDVAIIPVHEVDSDSLTSLTNEHHKSNVNMSWACVRQIHPTNASTTLHGRRLGIRENSLRVHRGFNKDKPEPMIHYKLQHYEPKTHITKSHFEPEHISKIRDHMKGPLRRMHEQYAEEQEVSSGDRCEMYSCKYKDGAFVETDDDGSGYAGKFVRRDEGVSKQTMRKPGGKAWASGCVISHKYKFIYIHVLKSGGTATKEFIRKSLCGEDDKDCKRVDPQTVQPYRCKLAMERYPHYFTFTFVRNPFARMFSIYSMMDGFPVKPSMRGRVTESLSFKGFVKMTPKQRKQYTKMHPSHYFKQTDFTLSTNDCPAFDFLGRVEHFDEDMRTILEHLGAKEMIEYLEKSGGVQPANTWGSNKKKSIDGGLNSVYSLEEVNTVSREYKQDFDLLGYDKDELPSD